MAEEKTTADETDGKFSKPVLDVERVEEPESPAVYDLDILTSDAKGGNRKSMTRGTAEEVLKFLNDSDLETVNQEGTWQLWQLTGGDPAVELVVAGGYMGVAKHIEENLIKPTEEELRSAEELAALLKEAEERLAHRDEALEEAKSNLESLANARNTALNERDVARVEVNRLTEEQIKLAAELETAKNERDDVKYELESTNDVIETSTDMAVSVIAALPATSVTSTNPEPVLRHLETVRDGVVALKIESAESKENATRRLNTVTRLAATLGIEGSIEYVPDDVLQKEAKNIMKFHKRVWGILGGIIGGLAILVAAVVFVQSGGCNRQPVVPAAENQPPTISTETTDLVVFAGNTASVNFSASDPEGGKTEIVTVKAPAHGSLSYNTSSIGYTPNEGVLRAKDEFTVQAKDEEGLLSGPVTVKVSVGQQAPSAEPKPEDTTTNGGGETAAQKMIREAKERHQQRMSGE